MIVNIRNRACVLRAGDAITFPSRLPHWNMNRSDGPVSVLFCVTPPSY